MIEMHLIRFSGPFVLMRAVCLTLQHSTRLHSPMNLTLVLQEGLTQLLRHSSCQDIVPWQHACILHALLHQGELAAASRYLSLRNPPIRTAEDLKMRLTILVANR